ncbi:hypothetical protein [Microbispora sp. NPDC049125]|uniref:hypothetical protein n=1 Tax=Microbispora sp. NPDC049125 TaxID=3154929 RepID=UPI0034656F53
MAEGGGNPAGDDRPRQLFNRYYDAPTTPLPRVRPEDLLQAPIRQEPATQEPGVRDRVRAAGRTVGRGVGDMPLRVVYTAGAAVVTVVAVLLVFLVFSGDKPEERERVQEAAAGGAGVTSAAPSASPTPSPSPVLPKVPVSRAMPIFPGSGSSTVSYVLDRKSGISYAKYGTPWEDGDLAPFAFAQRTGAEDGVPALIGSAPLPGAAPGTLATYADYRKIAARAAKWTLRHQPQDSKITWTASVPLRRGMGWLLGYKASYRIGAKKHSSQAFVMVAGAGKRKPALLFASVPDSRSELYRDLDMLFWTLSPL